MTREPTEPTKPSAPESQPIHPRSVGTLISEAIERLQSIQVELEAKHPDQTIDEPTEDLGPAFPPSEESLGLPKLLGLLAVPIGLEDDLERYGDLLEELYRAYEGQARSLRRIALLLEQLGQAELAELYWIRTAIAYKQLALVILARFWHHFDEQRREEGKASSLEQEADRLRREAQRHRDSANWHRSFNDEAGAAEEDATADGLEAHAQYIDGLVREAKARARRHGRRAKDLWRKAGDRLAESAESLEKAGLGDLAAECWLMAAALMDPYSLAPFLRELPSSVLEQLDRAHWSKKAAEAQKKAADRLDEQGKAEEARRARRRAKELYEATAEDLDDVVEHLRWVGDDATADDWADEAGRCREKAAEIPDGG